ncbi:MAG TPA: hypothetical protein PLN24_05515 [Victivallales bacterium]|nr:hypothetical protein [Victivallales bacterium]HPO89732.1 hypothetical protein [Victivallales bacterium]
MEKKISRLSIIISLFLSSIILLAEEITVTKKDGGTVRANFVKVDPNGDIWIKQGAVQQKIKSVDYSYARLKDKPAEIDSAEKALAAKDFAKAATAFADAYQKYKFVGFDVLCIYGEASALAGQGKKVEAINRLKTLDGYELLDEEKTVEYYDAKKLLATLLIDESKFDDALKVLAQLGQANDDDIAAFGFNSRGDILLKQNNKKDAVLMFLRTALLFPKENKERPYALLQIANTLKEMKDNRGSTFAEMLKTDYPGNPLIAQLK